MWPQWGKIHLCGGIFDLQYDAGKAHDRFQQGVATSSYYEGSIYQCRVSWCWAWSISPTSNKNCLNSLCGTVATFIRSKLQHRVWMPLVWLFYSIWLYFIVGPCLCQAPQKNGWWYCCEIFRFFYICWTCFTADHHVVAGWSLSW